MRMRNGNQEESSDDDSDDDSDRFIDKQYSDDSG